MLIHFRTCRLWQQLKIFLGRRCVSLDRRQGLLATETTQMFLSRNKIKMLSLPFVWKLAFRKCNWCWKRPGTFCSVPSLPDEHESQDSSAKAECVILHLTPSLPGSMRWPGWQLTRQDGCEISLTRKNEATELLNLAVRGSVSNYPVGKKGHFKLVQNSAFRLQSANSALGVPVCLTDTEDLAWPSVEHSCFPTLVERRVEMASLTVEAPESMLSSPVPSSPLPSYGILLTGT